MIFYCDSSLQGQNWLWILENTGNINLHSVKREHDLLVLFDLICEVYCSGVGSGGASAPPKVLICRKSGQKISKNFAKIPENLGKSSENPNKILKYLGKILENLVKNGAQRCLTSVNGTQCLQKNKWRPFLEVTLRKGLHDLCGRKFL